MDPNPIIKGRGAQINIPNRFFELSHEIRDDFLEYCSKEGEEADKNKTLYLEVFPKTIVNKVASPDVGMGYSMNMYQGCEHGCIYCYARNSHEYWATALVSILNDGFWSKKMRPNYSKNY